MINLEKPDYFINREWSWLEFNQRVLFEAEEEKNPLLERLKFLAIVTSNLEEFFMVRVAALKKQIELGITGKVPDQHSPTEQLDGIRPKVRKIISRQSELFNKKFLSELKKVGISILFTEDEIKPYENYLRLFFENEIKKVLTPLSVGPTHPFPNLVTGRIYLVLEIEAEDQEETLIEKSELSFVEIPTNVTGRFVQIKNEQIFIPLEKVIELFVEELYHGYHIRSVHVIRVTRDADFTIQEDEASDLLKEIENTIKRLHQRSVVKLEISGILPEKVKKILIEATKVDKEDIYSFDGMLNFKDLFEIYGKCKIDSLKDVPVHPQYPQMLKQNDIWTLLKKQDLLLYHPYHAYDPVVEMLEKAAEDPNVLAIKQTLYRSASNSKIIKALIKAAENGKYVTIVDELKARFDEKQNIEVARRLENAGAHVIYGIAGLKTHTKALMIIRKEKGTIRRYCHLATGNYNESTAKLYTDFSLFTSNDYIGEDISNLFNLLTGFSLPSGWNYIAAAPLNLRSTFMELIERETENAKRGIKAKIVAKMNSLLDQGIITALYKASIAGVKIKLIVRGICALRPGMKGLSENISITSVIGKFLEHSRIYYFYNNGDEEYYLSSADWMTRNLDRRVELLFPLLADEGQHFVDEILDIQFKDNKNAWKLNSDGSYECVTSKKGSDSFVEIERNIFKMEQQSSDTIPEIRPVRKISDD